MRIDPRAELARELERHDSNNYATQSTSDPKVNSCRRSSTLESLVITIIAARLDGVMGTRRGEEELPLAHSACHLLNFSLE